MNIKDTLDIFLKIAALIGLILAFNAYLDNRFLRRESEAILGDRTEETTSFFSFHTAPTDGIVTAWLFCPAQTQPPADAAIWALLGAIDDKLKMDRIASATLRESTYLTLTFPVRKDEHWKLDLENFDAGKCQDRHCFFTALLKR